MCRALNAVGFDTLIATTDADGAGRLNVPLEQLDQYGDVGVMFFRRRFSEAYKWSVGLSAWLNAHAAEFDVAHVHGVFSHSSIAAGRACRKANVPYVVRPLGTLDPWSVRQKSLRKQALLRLGADRLLSGAAAIHYTSADEQRLAGSVIDRLPPGVIVPNGVDDNLFATSARGRPESPSLLCLGRLDEKKGIDLLIQAFHALVQDPRFSGWRLVIAGDGRAACVAALHALADSGPAASKIVFPGWVAGAAKAALLSQASVFVLPSHQENFGISVAEALAASVPVVITRGVNLAADVAAARAGWIVERSAAALTELLRDVMGDDEELQRRGRAGRVLAERFRWSTVAKDLIAMYQRVLKAPVCAA